MNVVETFGFVILRSARNRVVTQVKRLKQPRYLIATLFGLGYWYLYFGRNLMQARDLGKLEASYAAPASAAFMLMGLFSVLSVWIFGSRQSTLAFSEAEIQFFFPAPASRRALLNYKLLKSALLSLVTTAFFTLFFGRAAVGSQLFFVVGLWLGITTLSFHSAAAARTRQRLAEHGSAGWVASLPTLLVVLGVGGALWWAVKRAGPLPAFEPTRQWVDASLHVLEVPPLSWVLWPLGAFANVVFAVDARAFAAAVPQALLVLALHYLWVISGDVSFEESSVLAAEKRAQALEARRAGNASQLLTSADKRSAPFKLAAHGPPEVALIWKGLIASGRLFNVRVLAIFGLAFVPMALFAGLMKSTQFALTMLGFLMLTFWLMGTLMGGAMSRSDLRRDIEFIDVLRALPMSGRQIVLGEALGALVPALVVQWGLLAGGLTLMQGDDLFFTLDLQERIVWGLALGIAGPAFTLAGILVQNAAVIFVPAWVANPKDGPRGPEASGVAMLVLIGTLLGVSLGLLPAALFALLVGFALLPLLGLWSLVAGAVALSAVAAFEAWVAAALLGKAFETVEPGA